MHPPSGSSGPHGSIPGMRPENSRPRLPADTFEIVPSQQGSSRNPGSNNPAGDWFFSSSTGAATHGRSAHPSNMDTMMGTAPAYYAPQAAPHDESVYARQYQEWVDSFDSQQQRQATFSTTHQPQANRSEPSYPYQQQYTGAGPSQQYGPVSMGGPQSQPTAGASSFDGSASYTSQNAGYTDYYEEILAAGRGNPSVPSSHPTTIPPNLYQSADASYSSTPDSAHRHQQQTFDFTHAPHPRRPERPTGATGAGGYAQYSHHNQPQPAQSNASSTQASSRSPTWAEESRRNAADPKGKSSNLLFRMHQPTAKGAESTNPSGLPHQTLPQGQGISVSTMEEPAKRPNMRKRARRDGAGEWSGDDEGSETESEDEEYAGGIRVGIPGVVSKGKAKDRQSRLPGACRHCKKLKMKCDFPRGDNTCKRCRAGGHICIVEGRKPRTAPNKREYLLAQIRQKDAIIESLLKQLHNPYTATPLSIASYRMATSPSDQNNRSILDWLDRLQSSVRDTGSKGGPHTFLGARETIQEESDHEEETQGDQDQEGDSDSDTLSSDDKIRSSLPDAHVPLGLIANLSLSNSKTSKKKKDISKDAVAIAEEDFNDDNVGVANEGYFMPGPATDLTIRATLIEQHSPPEILVHGLVTPEDVDKLFDIFFKCINPFVSLLDPVLHTPATTFARCPFLFTVVCAVASRYYTEKSEIYPIAMHFAKHSAATALIDGWKSVELCQAYILMSIYSVPARRWEEDRSWLYTGLAIRIATDLNLHHVPTIKPTSEKQEREILNKTRVWMICFNLDRSTATQFGKPSTIKEDFIVRNAKEWYKKSQYNHPYDVHLCGYSTLLQIIAKFHDEIFSDPSQPSRLNKNVDFRSVTLEHDVHLTNFHKEWETRFKEESNPDDPGAAFRCTLLPYLVAYSRLVMFSFGFQKAFQRGLRSNDNIFFTKCHESAKSVIENMVDGLAPGGYMRYAPDGHFVFAAFASAFLLKLLRPEFSSLLKKDEENEIFELIGRLIQTLSSPKIAIDDRHTPKLYARFLAGLLSRHRRDGATVGRLQTQPPPPHQPSGGIPGTSAGSMSTFSSSPSSGAGGTSATGGGAFGGSSYSPAPNPGDSIIYMPEATFASGTGPIHFGPSEINAYAGNTFTEEETLATMQAISNPAWWKDMMMPGFQWPEGSPSPPVSQQSSSNSPYSSDRSNSNNMGYSYTSNMPGLTGTFAI
ncbi:priB protein, variant 3 [Coprinopsis cinerea AmutBmut pab1-1]|nr:priB protein, variant 3 [Coprinopsis cinerea AmutBmut pab1-1]